MLLHCPGPSVIHQSSFRSNLNQNFRESPVLLAAPVPAGSEDDSSGSEEGGDPKSDPFSVPEVTDSRTGRVVERVINAHRLWRIAPFNFEKYPGMRMNVPPEKMAWTVSFLLQLLLPIKVHEGQQIGADE